MIVHGVISPQNKINKKQEGQRVTNIYDDLKISEGNIYISNILSVPT